MKDWFSLQFCQLQHDVRNTIFVMIIVFVLLLGITAYVIVSFNYGGNKMTISPYRNISIYRNWIEFLTLRQVSVKVRSRYCIKIQQGKSGMHSPSDIIYKSRVLHYRLQVIFNFERYTRYLIRKEMKADTLKLHFQLNYAFDVN